MMKKILCISFFLCIHFSFAQKKKTNVSVQNRVVVKTERASIVFNKKNDFLLVLQKDSLLLVKNKSDFNPTNVKITEFKIKNTILLHISWNAIEKKETPDRKEVATITENQIWNPVVKQLLLGNTKKGIDINEIVYLDRLKTASQTVTKKRNEGYDFNLMPNGEIVLTNKTTIQKYGFNEKMAKYELVKK